MPVLKPAYLIHGDDHGAVAERRAGLRALAEGSEGATASVELLEGDAGTPGGVALALAAMTLTIGRRVILVEGVERWREADVEKLLAPAMSEMPPDTTLALFAREEARVKAPAALHAAVERAGGQVVAQMTVKRWELPEWARAQAARLGISLDAAAAKALVAQVGERQQRLLRELEKLALEGGESEERTAAKPRQVSLQEVEQRAAHSAAWQAFGLADALVGAGGREASLAYLRLRQQGESLTGLIYVVARRLRDALEIALRLRGGESVAEVRRRVPGPPRAAARLVADVERTDPDRLREALTALADLEVDSRGGAPISARRSPLAGMSEDTLALRTIEAITR
jgi:DNA polymerase-3 subunit delta